MGRFIVIVLDGFGIGAMADAKEVRPQDENSNTLGSILMDFPNMKLPALEALGLMNAYGKESANMKFSKNAVFGKAKLKHWGADTFMGHQEIMGTNPKKPNAQPFQEKVDAIKAHLMEYGHKVETRETKGLRYLLVDDYVTVADNIDADFGMAYNCTAPLDYISFERELRIGHLVREIATVNRVIPFGGTGNSLDDILAAVEVREDSYIGIHAAKSKSYAQGYQCRHLGYGVNEKVQVPTILTEMGIPVTLLGKVADIVANEGGKSISCVPTPEVLDLTMEEIKNCKHGFICTNVQETDLAGHCQDSGRYHDLLCIADEKISQMLPMLTKDDVLLVMADHGNDPNIGHNKHTRENVPLLVYRKKKKNINLGIRQSLSDVGATVCAYFGAKHPENGASFLSLLEVISA